MRYHDFNLLKKVTFLPLFLTQFFGAFNDNAFKLAMLTIISYFISSSQSTSEFYQALGAALYNAPFFLFSATAGQLADRYDKSILTRWIKLLELILMILGAIGLVTKTIPLLFVVLTGMGLHSTLFGPIKYSIPPEQLPRDELLGATALLEASTFLAILLGTTLGSLSIGSFQNHAIYAIGLTVSVSIFGLIASFYIPLCRVSSEKIPIEWNIWHSTKTLVMNIFRNKTLRNPILAISWFWLLGSVILTKLPDYMHFVLNADTTVFAVFLALFSLGIAFGSLTISLLLHGKITLRYVPLSMFFLSIFTTDLYLATGIHLPSIGLQNVHEFYAQWNNIRITLDFFFLAFSGGLFIVPLYAYLQVHSNDNERARTIAANNIINSLAMVIGSLLVMGLLKINASIAFVFLFFAMLNGIVAMFLYKRK